MEKVSTQSLKYKYLVTKGFECRVLRPYLSSPLPGVYLPYIILEWMHIKLNLDNNCPDLQAFIDQLSDAGYQPFDLVSKKKLQPGRMKD